MSNKLKYINFENIGLVIFETHVQHSTMKQLVGHISLFRLASVTSPMRTSVATRPAATEDQLAWAWRALLRTHRPLRVVKNRGYMRTPYRSPQEAV
jgi:hypothetical protein